MLADLNLQELPLNVLQSLRYAIATEIRYRETYSEVKWPGLSTAIPTVLHWRGLPGKVAVSLPPDIRRAAIQKRLPYLGVLLAQDWEECFPQADRQRQDYYVYAHVDPRGKAVPLTRDLRLRGEPFYIGKGTGLRAWDLKRNQGHGKRIKSIREGGFAESAIVDIIAKDLTEQQALTLEAKLIYFFGSIYDELTKGCLVNLADQARPVFRAEMQALILPENSPELRAQKRQHRKQRNKKRWEGWQQTKVNCRYLPLEARQEGYIVSRIPPEGRDAFLDVAEMIALYHRIRTFQRLGAFRPAVEKIWLVWEQWTRRVLRYMQRLLNQQPANNVPLPPFTL